MARGVDLWTKTDSQRPTTIGPDQQLNQAASTNTAVATAASGQPAEVDTHTHTHTHTHT